MEDFMGELSACIHWRNEKRIKLSLGELSSMQYRRKRGLQRRGGVERKTSASSSAQKYVIKHNRRDEHMEHIEIILLLTSADWIIPLNRSRTRISQTVRERSST